MTQKGHKPKLHIAGEHGRITLCNVPSSRMINETPIAKNAGEATCANCLRMLGMPRPKPEVVERKIENILPEKRSEPFKPNKRRTWLWEKRGQ